MTTLITAAKETSMIVAHITTIPGSYRVSTKNDWKSVPPPAVARPASLPLPLRVPV